MARTFKISDAKRERCPLLLGLVGPSGSGKTYSALRLAIGIQKLYGGEVVYIDTEARRALHYAERFKFKHMDFGAPFGPLDYKDAIQAAIQQGAGVVVVDSMTHEHSGVGGVLWQAEKTIEEKGETHRKRAWIEPKRQRRELNNFIIQQGAGVAFVFCYRATYKIDMTPKTPVAIGYQHETTSPLMYEMIQQFLLTPGCNGIPELRPTLDAERQIVKSPAQFADWFKDGQQLDEAIGERFARWAIGDEGAPVREQPAAPSGEFAGWGLIEFIEYLEAAGTIAELAERFNHGKAAIKDPVELADFVRRKDIMKAALQSKPEYADDAVPFNP
jgi:ABC-type dipeptide/oligopeptide/nickel transport system ATPase subunit